MEADVFNVWAWLTCLGFGCVILYFISGKNIFPAIGLGFFISAGLSLFGFHFGILSGVGGISALLGYVLLKLIK